MNQRIFGFIIFGLLVTSGSVLAAPPRGLHGGVMACLSKGCEQDSGPVCAVDDSGMARTFENRCLADLAYCRWGIYYAVIKLGEC